MICVEREMNFINRFSKKKKKNKNFKMTLGYSQRGWPK